MRQKTFNELMLGFLRSPEGEESVGIIVKKAVDQSLTREIRFEDGKSDPGRVVERTETWNILEWLVKYLPHVEAAVRGCQSDAAQARNRAASTRDMLLGIIEAARSNGLNIEYETPLKIANQGDQP